MIRIAAAALLWAAALGALAQARPAPFAPPADPAPAAAPAAKPMVYALVSAVGGSLTFVRQREQVGSNRVDTYHRLTLPMPDSSLDGAVLRGLARVIRGNEPDAEIVYMRLNPKELEGVLAHRKGEAAIGKLAKAFDGMPERMKWDRIVVVTPKYLFPGHRGMGSKLAGLGVYVQPLYSASGQSSALGGGVEDLAPNGVSAEEDAVTPEGGAVRTSRYVAPYFYTQLWILDAKTLTVLDTEERYDFQKIYDPQSAAIDVQRAFTPEQLGDSVEKFVERSAARSLREAIGAVTVGDPKPIHVGPGDTPKKKP